MSSRLLRYGVLSSIPLLALVLGLAGCGKSGTQDKDKSGSSATKTSAPADSGKEAAGESDGMAKLSPEDRALAEKQKTCPVTDAPLGSMGTPVKVTLKGQTVFLCCAGCKEELNQNADKYLAKLKGAATPQ
ncbi:MAG: hypothetical protein ACYC35_19790 [Pirellulales bacterium]